MRKCFVSLIAIATLGIFAEGAWAESRYLGVHEPEAVIAACAKVGGVPWSGKGYGCTKENCDGKGGTCTGSCDSDTGGCTGHTPGRIMPPPGKYDLVKILTFAPGQAGPPGPGLLQPTPEGSPSGPSGLGTPKPTAPPPGKLY